MGVFGWLNRVKPDKAAAAPDREKAAACIRAGNGHLAEGSLQAAAACYRDALSADADNADAHVNLGFVLRELGRSSEARQYLARAVQLNPASEDAHYLLGLLAESEGEWESAGHHLATAVRLKPGMSIAWADLCRVLLSSGDSAGARQAAERGLAANPQSAGLLVLVGNLHLLDKAHEDALSCYDRALALKGDHAEAHCNRGSALKAMGRLDEAIASYDRAIAADPGYADAYSNLSVALQESGRLTEALAACDQALALNPDLVETHYNRGIVLHRLGRHNDALASYGRAIALRPGYAKAYGNRGNVYGELGRFADAVADYELAVSLGNEEGYTLGNLLLAQARICRWQSFPERLARLEAGVARGERVSYPFPVSVLTGDPELQRRAAETLVADRFPPRMDLGPLPAPRRHERIRIGYFSADFHDHATTYLMAELFELHDKTRFELIGLSFGPDRQDDMRRRVAAAFDRFIDVRARTDRDVARLARELEIDIAVDLKGYTQDSRTGIFAYRAAPIQVNYLGYPGSMGAPYMDYLVADEILIPPESRRHYSEKIAYLPGSYQINDSKRKIADRHFTREELGLPSQGFVFCCFNNNYKITPAVFDGWMRILQGVAHGVLWLFEDNRAAADNLRREAERRRIDPRRLVFAGRLPLPEHLARHRVADLFLDTLPCNAHTTASDALWAGLPVLTRAGATFAGRVAASLLGAVGMSELVTSTQADYEALAMGLASDPARLAALRARLNENLATAPLFNTRQYARHLERVYQAMVERHRSGQPPDHIPAGSVAGMRE